MAVTGLRVATSRTFDHAGTETNVGQGNDLAKSLFGAQSLTPADRWTLELSLAVNDFLHTVGSDTPRRSTRGSSRMRR